MSFPKHGDLHGHSWGLGVLEAPADLTCGDGRYPSPLGTGHLFFLVGVLNFSDIFELSSKMVWGCFLMKMMMVMGMTICYNPIVSQLYLEHKQPTSTRYNILGHNIQAAPPLSC